MGTICYMHSSQLLFYKLHHIEYQFYIYYNFRDIKLRIFLFYNYTTH